MQSNQGKVFFDGGLSGKAGGCSGKENGGNGTWGTSSRLLIIGIAGGLMNGGGGCNAFGWVGISKAGGIGYKNFCWAGS